MKHIRKLFIVLALAAPTWAQTALVSADLKTTFGEFLPSRAKVTFRLQNYGSSIPRITSGPLAGVIVQAAKDIKPNAGGEISTTVYRNDSIDPPDTWWSVEYYYNGTLTAANSYTFLTNTVNLNAAAPLSSYPVPAVPAPPNAVLTNPPGGAQQNVSGPLSMTALIVNPGNSSVMGNSATPSLGVILRMDNTFTNPDLLSSQESRVLSAVNRRTQTLAESVGADQYGVVGVTTVEAGTTQNIGGQMKPLSSEIYLLHPTAGSYTITTATGIMSSVAGLETNTTLTNWYGLRINDPCRVGGGGCAPGNSGGGAITNGYAIYIEGVTSPPVTNRAAIKINALNQDGAIEWTVNHLRELADGQAVKEIVSNGPIQVGEVGGTVAQLRLPLQTTVDGTHPTLDAGVGALQGKSADGHLYWCVAGTCTDLTPSAPGAGAFVNNGNAFAAAAVLGTTDNNYLSFISNSVEFGRIQQNGGNPRLIAGLTSTDIASGRGSIISGDAICTASATTNAAVGCITNSGGNIILSSNHSGAGTTGDLLFDAPTEAMRIATSTLAVGIGTGASPSRRLHVTDAGNNTQMRLTGANAGGAGAGLEIYEGGTFEASIRAQSSSTNGFSFVSQAGVPIVFFPANLQTMRLTSAQKVIIGSGTSTNYNLEVNGAGFTETCGGACSLPSQLLIKAGVGASTGISFSDSTGTLNGLINSTAAGAVILSNEVANAGILVHHVVAQVDVVGALRFINASGFYTFATLPAALQGGMIFCSDCKSSADAAVVGSIAVNGGTGVHLGSQGTNWRTMY